MTGYASKKFDFADFSMTVEVKSLNNKFLEIRFRLPSALDHLEERFRRVLKRYVQRGKVDVAVKLSASEERELASFARLIDKYHGLLERAQEGKGYRFQASLSELIALKSLFDDREELAYADVPEEPVEKAFEEAVAAFQESRAVEGESTLRDILSYLDSIASSLSAVERLAPSLSEKFKAQIGERIRELVEGKVDDSRVMMEVGIFATKIDVSEEISRVGGHIRRFRETARAGGPCGRELDFIAQEIGREVNTIGSKVPDYAVSAEVVSMKTQLDKIKEQVRNIE